MSQLERLVLMAEDELAEYRTKARRMERLRQKIGLSLSLKEQQNIKQQLIEGMPTDPISAVIENQRQAVALPFWGIAGLGLLFGISFFQPLDFIATVGGGFLAFKVQKRGWNLQARRLVIATLEDIEKRIAAQTSESA